MAQRQKSGGLDIFRIVAALLVISIHTSPFAGINENLDFFVTRIFARVAVPFFFMVTGQYVLSEFGAHKENGGASDSSKVWRYLKKAAILYGISIIIYIPIGVYAGHYKELGLYGVLRMLVFDGTFYHLWYFPACIVGVLLVYGMSRCLDIRKMTWVAAVLYIVGLLGDSYYGLAVRVPALGAVYTGLFKVFSYTRNGIFFAPLFLVLGMRSEELAGKLTGRVRSAGLIISFLLMTAEGFALHINGIQRHDSMYVFLPAVMVFLYQLLLGIRVEQKREFRELSTWIYILHPAVIVLVRAAAKIVPALAAVAGNSLLNYMAVGIASVLISWLLVLIKHKTVRAFGNNAADNAGYAMDRAWIELDRAALKRNVEFLKNRVPKNCELMPAVKAQAYGHGAVPITRELESLGINSFCVACVDEAVELRRAGVKGMLLVLGYTHPKQWELLLRYGITQTVVDFGYAVRMNDYGIRHHRKFHVHVGVDTGMHRLGESSENIDNICRIMDMKNLKVDGIFTHLSADDTLEQKDVDFTKMQVGEFETLKRELTDRGYTLPKTHISASYGVLNYPELEGDYARVGIALYGVLSTVEDEKQWEDRLSPVLSLKARVASVRELNRGECAGYGMAFTAQKTMRIATLAIGYADGLPRELSLGKGYVLIDGKRAPIIGRICMDQTIVDVSDIDGVKAGNIAVIIGTSKTECIRASQLARESGTITNETVSRMGVRLKRVIV